VEALSRAEGRHVALYAYRLASLIFADSICSQTGWSFYPKKRQLTLRVDRFAFHSVKDGMLPGQDNQKSISAALSENALQLKNAIQSSHQGFVTTNAEANKQVTDLMTKTKEQISFLDAALTEELKKSLESLGRQLAALSERFVSDYGPLTEKLRRVVEMAK
jgi:hypothetical protein